MFATRVATMLVVAMTGLGGITGTADASTRDPIRLAEERVVPEQYIVVLAADVALPLPTIAPQLAGKYGGKVRQIWGAALSGFSVQLTEQQAALLAADPLVAHVEPVVEVQLADTQAGAPWGLDRLDQRALPLDTKYSYPTAAGNVTAYILDTGIRTSHTDFGGRASVGFDAIGDGKNGEDCQGHGTHVAGTIGGTKHGVAKQVKLVAVRLLNCQGSGTSEQVVSGINWVTQNARKPAVVNMSLGGGANSATDQAVRNSIASGLTYAVAAGNGNAQGVHQDACTVSPARVPEAITVGAVDKTDTKASFSNYGTCVDIFAPGVSISSTTFAGDTSTGRMSGTSMATPHVAGAAALHLAANPTATPTQVQTSLFNTATTGSVANAMAGSPNRLLYTDAAATTPPAPLVYSTTSDVAIPGTGTVTSPITVSGRTGNAPATP